MFVGDEVRLPVDFETARVRLQALVRGGLLTAASVDAYSEGITGLLRVGPPGLFRVVRVQFTALTDRDNVAGFAMRWEVDGQSAALFPVLDADLEVVKDGTAAAWLTFTGSYRPPAGALGQALDRAILHRVASATIKNFLARIAADLSGVPAAPAGGPEAHLQVT